MEIDVSKLPTSSNVKVDKIFVTVFLADNLQEPGFKGFAKSITSVDAKGPFDILPTHENFVTKFFKTLEIVTENGEKVSYNGKNGIIEVANNIVRIYAEKTEGKS